MDESSAPTPKQLTRFAYHLGGIEIALTVVAMYFTPMILPLHDGRLFSCSCVLGGTKNGRNSTYHAKYPKNHQLYLDGHFLRVNRGGGA